MSAEIKMKKEKAKRTQLNELREKRKALINEVRQLERERDELRTRRDELNKKVRELFDAARVEREARDKINQDVQLNKELRKISQEDADKIAEQLEELQSQLKGVKGGAHQIRRIADKIKEIEFKLETDPKLTKEKEQEYIDELSRLFQKFENLEVASEKQEELKLIRQKWRAHKDNARTHHRKVKELAEQSQNHHDKMIEYIGEARKLRTEADSTHSEVKEISNKIREIRQKINAISKEADIIRKELGEETMMERNRRRKEEEAAAKREEIERTKTIKERMEAGGKLGLEDLKVLLQQGELFKDK